MERAGQRVVVTDRAFPVFDDADLVEDAAANRGAASPAEVLSFFGEHGDDGRVPGGEKRRGQIAAIGDEPAHGGRGADSGISQWGNHALEPGFPGAAVGISEREEFKIGRELFDGEAEIVALFSALDRGTGDQDVRLGAGTRCDALY